MPASRHTAPTCEQLSQRLLAGQRLLERGHQRGALPCRIRGCIHAGRGRGVEHYCTSAGAACHRRRPLAGAQLLLGESMGGLRCCSWGRVHCRGLARARGLPADGTGGQCCTRCPPADLCCHPRSRRVPRPCTLAVRGLAGRGIAPGGVGRASVERGKGAARRMLARRRCGVDRGRRAGLQAAPHLGGAGVAVAADQ